VSPDIQTVTASVPSQELADDVARALHGAEGVELLVWPMDGPAPRERIDIVVPPYMSNGSPLPLLAGVETRLVQGQSIGYEGIDEKLPPGTTWANAASVHETSTAELAVGLAIAAQRHFADFVRAQDAGRWAPVFANSLADRRVLLLGYGGVGKAIAARLKPFEVDITAVASRSRTEDGIRVHAIDDLHDLLPQAEIVMISLPGGDATRHVIDAAALQALPDGALLVNVGRGPLIDTDAFVAEGGRIRAALDVTDPEPLPADHPLWTMPGVLIAPHVGGATSAMRPRIARLIARQIVRMQKGEAPLNVVFGG
jgi:phosphoglycerate dehydrogenase-like enzyme